MDVVRFGEGRYLLHPGPQAVGGLAPQTLAGRLTQLEDAGLISREIIAARPPHAEYKLTDAGRRVADVLQGLLRASAPAAR